MIRKSLASVGVLEAEWLLFLQTGANSIFHTLLNVAIRDLFWYIILGYKYVGGKRPKSICKNAVDIFTEKGSKFCPFYTVLWCKCDPKGGWNINHSWLPIFNFCNWCVANMYGLLSTWLHWLFYMAKYCQNELNVFHLMSITMTPTCKTFLFL